MAHKGRSKENENLSFWVLKFYIFSTSVETESNLMNHWTWKMIRRKILPIFPWNLKENLLNQKIIVDVFREIFFKNFILIEWRQKYFLSWKKQNSPWYLILFFISLIISSSIVIDLLFLLFYAILFFTCKRMINQEKVITNRKRELSQLSTPLSLVIDVDCQVNVK